MNQILVTGNNQNEPESNSISYKHTVIKRKTKKIEITIILFFLIIILSYYVYASYLKSDNKYINEDFSEEIVVSEPEIETVLLGKNEEEKVQEIMVSFPEKTISNNVTVENNIEYTNSEFGVYEIDDTIFQRINNKSYSENGVVSLDSLRYIKVLHIGYDGKKHNGELIVNEAIAEDILEIFKTLYEAKYEIEKIKLVDEYDAIDELSMEDNNTSAFNNRNVNGTYKY